MKNQSAFPVVNSNTEYGLTKLEYLVAHNVSAAVSLIDGISARHILDSIGCSDEGYDFEKHYPKYLAKIQILLAKELIKQLENDISRA